MRKESRSKLAKAGKNSVAQAHKAEIFAASAQVAKLRKSDLEKLMSEFFFNCDEPVFVVNPFSGLLLLANNAAEIFFKRPERSLNGFSIGRLYPKCGDALYMFIEEAVNFGSARSRNLIAYRPDGALFELEHSATTLTQFVPTLLLVRVLDLDALHQRDFRDGAERYLKKGIRDWLRDEQYFREIEREHRLILASAGEGIYGVDINGCTTFLNPAAESMLGYSADELIGADMHERIHHHQADGTFYPKEDCLIVSSFLNGEPSKANDEVFWRKDGSALPVEYTSTPILDDGEKIGAVIVFRDITDRLENEEQLQNALIENAALRERLELENAYLQEEIRQTSDHINVIGNSDSIKTLLSQIDLVAQTDANVIIIGEGGTGKELTAHEIHRASNRSERPLIRVNCAAIPPELFESELFGHVKGSFPGAIKNRVGKLELADGGTLFLDEVGDLEIVLQAKLLRVLQEGKYERVGEERPNKVDIRLIASTNKDLKKAVDCGDFREDLYFFLNVFPIECVSLRHRISDIPLLAEHYLFSTCARLNLSLPKLTKANVQALKSYSWPGNIRELQNVIERAAILQKSGKLNFQLPDDSLTKTANSEKLDSPLNSREHILTAKELESLERENLQRALKACDGKVAGPLGAALLLGMKPTTVYSRIKSWKLND